MFCSTNAKALVLQLCYQSIRTEDSSVIANRFITYEIILFSAFIFEIIMGGS